MLLLKPHYYPAQVAAELLARWPSPALLPVAELEQFISVAYQASLLFEEGQPVRCRLLFGPAAELPPEVGEGGLYILKLAEPRAYDEQEIRRLSPALHAPGGLLAVWADDQAGLFIWGVLRSQQPPRVADTPWPDMAAPAPAVLLLDVRGPGNLVFYCGNRRVLTLQYGHVEGHGFVDYPVAWSRGRLAENTQLLQQELGAATVAALPGLSALAEQLAHYVMRRMVARVRASGHGGLLVLVPTATLTQHVGPTATLRPKYPVHPPAATPPYSRLLLAIVARLRELGDVSWLRYQQADDTQLLELTAAVDQYADLLADLMNVDGALVLTKQLAVIGFGIEVVAPHRLLAQVYRALDADATQLQAEVPEKGGTRHRAAYRLCLAEPESLALVISQDGGVRFVHAQTDQVIFWEQLTL